MLQVDTYAKKLFIKNDKDARESLYKLKVTLSCYLLLEQALKPADKRYDSFFASILSPGSEDKPRWPDGVSIVTWNYDTQLEKSYKEFCCDPVHVYEGITQAKNIKRLNGICGVLDREETRDLCHLGFDKSYFERMQDLFEAQMKRSVPFQPSISFAWEKEDLGLEVGRAIAGTTTLVIVGYSFQYFNRDIDEILLLTMADSLEKIYIQVAENDQAAIQERLLTLFKNDDVRKDMKAKITPVSPDLFFIPDNMPI